MITGVKLLVSSLGVVGVGGVIAPLTLWQTGYMGGNGITEGLLEINPQLPQADSSIVDSFGQPSSSATSQTKSLIGNCQVDNESFKDIIKGLSKIDEPDDDEEDEDFIAIICQNSGTSFDKKWTGFFPSDAFEYVIPDDGEKLEITTKTSSAPETSEEKYRTTFKGRLFSRGSLVGDWGVNTQTVGDKELKVVKEVSNERGESQEYGKFYVLFQDLVSK